MTQETLLPADIYVAPNGFQVIRTDMGPKPDGWERYTRAPTEQPDGFVVKSADYTMQKAGVAVLDKYSLGTTCGAVELVKMIWAAMAKEYPKFPQPTAQTGREDTVIRINYNDGSHLDLPETKFYTKPSKPITIKVQTGRDDVRLPCGDVVTVKITPRGREYTHKGFKWYPSETHRVALQAAILHEDSLKYAALQQAPVQDCYRCNGTGFYGGPGKPRRV